MSKRHWHIYVDDRYTKTLYSGWTCHRIMAQLRRKYPDARTLEVRDAETDESHHLLRASR